ncbi:MAG: hypothetical protein IJB96_04580, partial [Lachnospira sp.]|nr:hypothetical protein [Lachnospira sp.]
VSWYGFSGYANISLTKATNIHVCKNTVLTWAESVVATGTITYTTDELGTGDVAGKVNDDVCTTLNVSSANN